MRRDELKKGQFDSHLRICPNRIPPSTASEYQTIAFMLKLRYMLLEDSSNFVGRIHLLEDDVERSTGSRQFSKRSDNKSFQALRSREETNQLRRETEEARELIRTRYRSGSPCRTGCHPRRPGSRRRISGECATEHTGEGAKGWSQYTLL